VAESAGDPLAAGAMRRQLMLALMINGKLNAMATKLAEYAPVELCGLIGR
jgi:hypothetical protein